MIKTFNHNFSTGRVGILSVDLSDPDRIRFSGGGCALLSESEKAEYELWLNSIMEELVPSLSPQQLLVGLSYFGKQPTK